jgi:hypothetical protein
MLAYNTRIGGECAPLNIDLITATNASGESRYKNYEGT